MTSIKQVITSMKTQYLDVVYLNDVMNTEQMKKHVVYGTTGKIEYGSLVAAYPALGNSRFAFWGPTYRHIYSWLSADQNRWSIFKDPNEAKNTIELMALEEEMGAV